MRRTLARGLPLFLLTLLALYLLLPFFGNAWHNLAPEHDHIYLGADQVNESLFMATEAGAALGGMGRGNLLSGPVVVHAFNPAAALQVLAIVMGFGTAILLVVPIGLSQRVALAELFLRFPPLLPLDPPPVG
jgi:hypothetical protein